MRAVAYMGHRRYAYIILVRNLKGCDQLEVLNVDKRIMLNNIKVTRRNIMNLQFPYKMVATTFSRRALVYDIS
jgi:hypothetical protein